MRKRLTVRADDVGYTEVYDLGIYKSIEQGIVTCADVMLDSPHTVEALKWLRERPWITVGWHRHLWESPVLPPEEVPNMVDAEGRFKWRHRHQELMADVPYEEAYRELEAEVLRCIDAYGAPPYVTNLRNDPPEFSRAMDDVCAKYGIRTTAWEENVVGARSPGGRIVRDYSKIPNQYDLAYFKDYKPWEKLYELQWTEDGQVLRGGGHPGYCDEHILAESSCNLHRTKELVAMIRPETIQWIIDNKIELVNLKDVVEGTDTFQQHLKEINSPMWIGNF